MLPVKFGMLLLFSALVAAAPSPPPLCEASVRPLIDEGPLLLYTDLNNPSETGLVDDAAVWEARRTATGARRTTNGSAAASDYAARKSNTRLRGPAGVVLVPGGDVAYWAEQEAGAVRSCVLVDGACVGNSTTVLDGLDCPVDLAIDFHRGHMYLIQYGNCVDPGPSCGTTPRARISRAALAASADGESALVDVVTDGLNCPVFLAVDALWGADGSASGGGLLFWSDPGREAVVRANLDGSAAATVLSLAHPSGIAVDSARAALYVTQQVRGASLIWSDYAGDWQRHVTRNRYFEPRGLAVDPTDGAVVVVEMDSFDRMCSPAPGTDGGAAAVTCARLNLGRISRISCAWPEELALPGALKIQGEAPAPYECCCHAGRDSHGGVDPLGCALDCAAAAPPPPPPPPLEPGAPRAPPPPPAPRAPPPPPTRPSVMVVDDEVIVDVGGYIDQGRLIKSWGDPQNVALLPPVSLPALVLGGPRRRSYGDCDAGCGRPTASSKCAVCPVGTYGKGGGICAQCSPGTFGNATVGGAVTPAEACSACPPGRYAPAYGASACVPCVIGTFCEDGWVLHSDGALEAAPPSGGIPLPIPCPRGTYNPSPGGPSPESCLKCPAGTARHAVGGTTIDGCDACEPGTFAGAPGAANCTACAPSTYQPSPGAAACAPCPPGMFSNVSGALQCVQCPIGSFSAAGAGDDPMCDACPAGRYSDSTGATECKACPVGTVGIGRRATSVEEGCVPCANGTFSLVEAATACMACPTEVELDDEGEEIPPPDGCPPVDSAAAPLPRAALTALLLLCVCRLRS